MASDPDDPRIGDISEGAVLRAILARTGTASHALLGPGDDAAVVSAPSGSVVATTDTLVDGPDFRTAWSSGYDLGWKAAAVNLADVAAMGAAPTALLVALAVPRETRLSFVAAMADGLRDACDALAPGCAVVGGDLTVSDLLTVAVTALGDLAGRSAVTRAGARPGDVVTLAGELGAAAAGLETLFASRRGSTPVPVDRAALDGGQLHGLDRQLRPAPPVALGRAAADAGATAMMDVSDGLTLDAGRMADASAVTVDFTAASIDEVAFGGDRARALRGGEDHGLLATFAADAPLPEGFHAIGSVVARGADAVLLDGRAIAQGGWDPYRDWDGIVSG